VAASPFEPAGGVAGRVWPADGGGEQPLDLVDGERDKAGVAGRRLVWPDGRRGLGVGAVPELACSHVWVRAKHDLSEPIRADRSRSAVRAPILAAAAALCSFVLTSNMIAGGCAHVTGISRNPAHHTRSDRNWRLPY
jgi:hypothetical protein